MLNRYIPFDAIVRWWYLLVIVPAIGLIFSLASDLSPITPRPIVISHIEGPPSFLQNSKVVLHQSPGWKEDLLSMVLGFLAACGIIWLLEEIRALRQHIREP